MAQEIDDHVCRLADPLAPPSEVPQPFVTAICTRAAAHRVEAIVLRKLVEQADHPSVRKISNSVLSLTALTMMLEHRQAPLALAIRERGLPAAIVKGRVFASRLYPQSEDRPWTDIDIVAAPTARDEIAALLRETGYRPHGGDGAGKRKREEKWGHPDHPALLIELHGDLVHYPMLRRGVRFGWTELIAAGDGDPEAPLALFATAVVHASLGHKFHELRLLVDVLQAFRNLGAADRLALPARMTALGLRLEAALSLRLVADIFDLNEARLAEEALGLPWQSPLAAGLVRARDVMSADGPRLGSSHLRRHAFRWLQQAHLSRVGGP